MKNKLNKIEKDKMRTWVELDRGAIKKNYETFRGMLKKEARLMSVVKSNAYGHGLVPFAQEVSKLGVDWLGVDSFDEALELRSVGITKPIMVFGFVSPAYFGDAIKKNISVTISSINSLNALAKMKKSPKIHIKVDTGLSRQGFLEEQMGEVLKILKKNKSINLEGVYSHFAIGEDPKGKEYTDKQVEIYLKWVEAFKNAGYKPIRHICATSSTMMYPEYHFDMVRVGIGMYGLWSSKELKEEVGKKYKLYPVLSWKAIMSEIKNLKKGTKVGYDLTEELKRDSIIAIVPVGYWHGYPRMLSRKGTLSVQGKKAKVVGNVSMDMIMINVTGIPGIKISDEVAIIGGEYGHYAEADMMAQDSDTINYEIVTRINPIIKRFYRINPQVRRVIV